MTGLGASTVSGSSTLNVSFVSPQSGEVLQSGYYFGGGQPFFVDRGLVHGLDNFFFTDPFSVADVWNTMAGTWRVQAVIDRSVLEVFDDGGAPRGYRLVLTRPAVLTLGHLATADVSAGVQVRVTIWSVQSAWVAYENGQGTVVGNVTGAVRDSYD